MSPTTGNIKIILTLCVCSGLLTWAPGRINLPSCFDPETFVLAGLGRSGNLALHQAQAVPCIGAPAALLLLCEAVKQRGLKAV